MLAGAMGGLASYIVMLLIESKQVTQFNSNRLTGVLFTYFKIIGPGQDQTQQALNNAIPKQAYYATNAMLSYDMTNLSTHVPTQAVVDNDDEEDMDISD